MQEMDARSNEFLRQVRNGYIIPQYARLFLKMSYDDLEYGQGTLKMVWVALSTSLWNCATVSSLELSRILPQCAQHHNVVGLLTLSKIYASNTLQNIPTHRWVGSLLCLVLDSGDPNCPFVTVLYMNRSTKTLEYVLIDGDHSDDLMRKDLMDQPIDYYQSIVVPNDVGITEAFPVPSDLSSILDCCGTLFVFDRCAQQIESGWRLSRSLREALKRHRNNNLKTTQRYWLY